jgi:ABC-2 type transport system permease protein
MNPARALAVAGRIVRQFVRDKRACALVLVAPLLIMSLFWVLLDTSNKVPRIALQARGLAALFIGELEERLMEPPEDEDDELEVVAIPDGMSADDAIRQGLADAVLVFPPDFVEQRAVGKRSKLALHVEGADPMRAASVLSRLRKAVPDSVGDLPRLLPVDCPDHCADAIPEAPPEIDQVKLYGSEIDDTMDYFIPVLPPFFAFFFVFVLSGMTFLRERIGGTAERLLASPLTRSELVAGYVLGFLPAAFVQATVVILFARYALGGPWGGAAAVIAVFLLALVAECLGVFVSAFARSEFQVMQFIPIIVLPQILLSGMIWPIADFPRWLAVIARCLPVTYAVDAIRDSAIRQLGFEAVWPSMAALVGFFLAGLVLASSTVRKS